VSSLAVARAGKLLAAGGTDGLIKLWDVETGRLIRNLPMHVLGSSLAFTAGNREVGHAVLSPMAAAG
jgi:WD40 repeat protein